MKKIFLPLLIVPLVVLSERVAATSNVCPNKPAIVANGFFTGNDAVNEPDAWLRAYVVGFVNAITVSGILGVATPCMRASTACFVDRTDQQLAAMLRKFLNDNPSRWHESLNTITYAALLAPCLNP